MNDGSIRRIMVLGLAVLGLCALPALAGGGLETPEWSELTLKMESEGWQQVQAKVFERKLGDSKVEHLGYGPEGLSWTIGELNRHLQRLVVEFNLLPSIELAKTIEGLSATISKAEAELQAMSRAKAGLSSEALGFTGSSCDPICYGATADAYHQTSQQGVGALAQAKFNNTCGHQGETYAYAYARATLGTTTTQVTQEDGPKFGTALTSTAQASVAGGSSALPCFSTAASYVQSSTLEFSYITSDTNDGYCPVPPAPIASIIGTNYEYFTTTACRSRTWTAAVSGGVTPYTYQWKVNGVNVGTGSSYTRNVCPTAGSFTLSLTVTGANGLSSTPANLYVSVIYEPTNPCLNLLICPEPLL